jgi:hypothetical protein
MPTMTEACCAGGDQAPYYYAREMAWPFSTIFIFIILCGNSNNFSPTPSWKILKSTFCSARFVATSYLPDFENKFPSSTNNFLKFSWYSRPINVDFPGMRPGDLYLSSF